MADRFKSLDLRANIPIMIEQTQEDVLDLNRAQLYERSVDNTGTPLRLYRSQPYALQKNRRNPKPGFGRPDLYETGAFFRGFYLRVGRNVFTISSRDGKTSDLVKKYTPNIFGLDEKSRTEYRPIITGAIVRFIKQRTKV